MNITWRNERLRCYADVERAIEALSTFEDFIELSNVITQYYEPLLLSPTDIYKLGLIAGVKAKELKRTNESESKARI
jgi:hypothetical protein